MRGRVSASILCGAAIALSAALSAEAGSKPKPQISAETVKRDWRMAKAWLRVHLTSG